MLAETARPATGTRPERVHLYRAYNNRGRLLYTGITARPVNRFKQHESAPWFRAVTAVDIEYYEDRAAALKAERHAIETEWPLWNLEHSPDSTAAWLRSHKASDAYRDCLAGKPRFAVLHGAAKQAHERRADREFRDRIQHAFHVHRLVERATSRARPGDGGSGATA